MTTKPPIDLQRIADEYAEDGRPLIDTDLHLVLVDCPSCRAQDSDPTGMWRPVRIVPRGKLRIVYCTACDRSYER